MVVCYTQDSQVLRTSTPNKEVFVEVLFTASELKFTKNSSLFVYA